jgi:hypothetical protein
MEQGDRFTGWGKVFAYLASLGLAWGAAVIWDIPGDHLVTIGAGLSLLFGAFAGWRLAIGIPVGMAVLVLFGTMPMTEGSELGVFVSFWVAGWVLLIAGGGSLVGAVIAAAVRALDGRATVS